MTDGQGLPQAIEAWPRAHESAQISSVAVCCSVLQCVAVCCSVSHSTLTRAHALSRLAVCYD